MWRLIQVLQQLADYAIKLMIKGVQSHNESKEYT